MVKHAIFNIDHLDFINEVVVELMIKEIVVYRKHRLCFFEHGVVLISGLQVHRNETCHPIIAMHNIWRPTKLLYRFYHALAKEYRPFIIVLVEIVFFVKENGLTVKII